MSQIQTQGPPRPSGPLAILTPAKDHIAAMLPPSIGKDERSVMRYMRSAAMAMSRNPTLAKCSPASIVDAVVTGAELGLDFAPSLGLAYLVPYGDKCTFLIGYRGLIALAMRSGEVTKIEAELVYDGDDFTREHGTNPQLHHVPGTLGQPRGKLVGAYAIATLKNGDKTFCVMDRNELDAVRMRSKSQDGPWKTDPGEMYRKTPVRRLCKMLNLNTADMARALDVENQVDPDVQIVADVPAYEPIKTHVSDNSLVSALLNHPPENQFADITTPQEQKQHQQVMQKLQAENAPPIVQQAAETFGAVAATNLPPGIVRPKNRKTEAMKAKIAPPPPPPVQQQEVEETMPEGWPGEGELQ